MATTSNVADDCGARTARKLVSVPLNALGQLFDLGNYGSTSNGPTALDLARNAIRHAAIELRVIGDAAGNPDAEMLDEEVTTHCHRVACQLEAALEIVDALRGCAASVTESEATE